MRGASKTQLIFQGIMSLMMVIFFLPWMELKEALRVQIHAEM